MGLVLRALAWLATLVALVRTAYPGTQSAGQVLTSANFTKTPGGWIGYAEVTASQTGITTATDLTGLTVTVTVGSSRRLRVIAGVRISGTVADGSTIVSLLQDGGSVNQGQYRRASTEDQNVTLVGVIAPSSGSHTYKLQLQRVSGTGTVGVSASAGIPSFILVEDIGPSS